MRKTSCTLASIGLLSIAVWAQQPGTATAPVPSQTPAFAPSNPAAGPDVSDPPICPTGLSDSLATDGIVGKDLDGVTPPKAKFTPEAKFSDEARKAARKMRFKSLFSAISLISLVVDVAGNPQNICLKKPAGFGLDAQAAKAVRQYRFEPAVKDGKPVPMRLTVEVNFRTY